MIIKNKKGDILAHQARLADSFSERLIGLMFLNEMNSFDALIIKNCKSVHTCFMRFPIDLVFIDKKNIVKRVYRNFKPWRITPIIMGAKSVVEFRAGTIEENCQVGEEILLCSS